MTTDPTVARNRPKRRTFVVLPLADRVYGCARCHRKLRAGERVTISYDGSFAEVRHAGRKCPPAFRR